MSGPRAGPGKERIRADTQVGPYRVDCNTQQARRNGRGRSPAPTGLPGVPSSGPMYLRHGFRQPNFAPKFGASVMGIGPYGEKGKPNRPPWPAAHSGASAARMQGMGGGGGRDHPQKCSATSDNPSVAAKPRQLPLHKGALACGGRGGHCPVIGVPSNPRRGGTEPAPYANTESADLWADVLKAWLPPTKFRAEIWGVSHRHRPLRKDERIRIPMSLCSSE